MYVHTNTSSGILLWIIIQWHLTIIDNCVCDILNYTYNVIYTHNLKKYMSTTARSTKTTD